MFQHVQVAHLARTVRNNVRKIIMENCADTNVAAMKTNIVILYTDVQVLLNIDIPPNSP